MAEGTGTPVTPTAGALADSSDLTTFGYAATAAAFLVRASVRVKSYARQEIAAGSSTVDLRYPFLLPQRPVVSVTSVSWLADDGTAEALTLYSDYSIEGQKVICDAYKDKVLRVAYSHGFSTIPDELKEIVCAVAARMAATPAGLAAGYQSESADGETIGYGSDAFAGVAELTKAEKRVIDRIYPHSRSVPSVAVTM